MASFLKAVKEERSSVDATHDKALASVKREHKTEVDALKQEIYALKAAAKAQSAQSNDQGRMAAPP